MLDPALVEESCAEETRVAMKEEGLEMAYRFHIDVADDGTEVTLSVAAENSCGVEETRNAIALAGGVAKAYSMMLWRDLANSSATRALPQPYRSRANHRKGEAGARRQERQAPYR